jgi:hypothetical protein
VLRPGIPHGLKISHDKYLQLGQITTADDVCPAWLIDATRRTWDLEISGQAVNDAVIVRTQSTYGTAVPPMSLISAAIMIVNTATSA